MRPRFRDPLRAVSSTPPPARTPPPRRLSRSRHLRLRLDTFAASDYTADIASHVVDFYHTTWNLFLTHYGNGSPDAVVKDYIDGALVSPDFKTENPKKPVSLDKETRP